MSALQRVPVPVARTRRILMLSAAMLLAACAAPRLAPVPGVQSWSGRLALIVDSQPPQSYSAGFDLRGSPAAGELLLTSPLGQALATVVWSADGAEIRQGEQVTRRASLAELSAELGGADVPVSALFGWLRGEQPQAQGWQADLSRHHEGRITARRSQPLPTADLRVVFEP
jgi:outer membrane lipoprotein LolB